MVTQSAIRPPSLGKIRLVVGSAIQLKALAPAQKATRLAELRAALQRLVEQQAPPATRSLEIFL